jgi:hypothetical protein
MNPEGIQAGSLFVGTALGPGEYYLVVHVWIMDEDGNFLINREQHTFNQVQMFGQPR